MKRKTAYIVVLCTILIALASAFGISRISNAYELSQYRYGTEQGYLTGYSIGYIDGGSGEKQDSHELAMSIAPFDHENIKWKAFVVSFSEGYAEGYNKQATKTD